jgi:hypothetical protein
MQVGLLWFYFILLILIYEHSVKKLLENTCVHKFTYNYPSNIYIYNENIDLFMY